MKRGHPTKLDQKKITDSLEPYYEKGISATVTARHTGLNRKTVRKYFNEWDGQIKFQDDFLYLARITKKKSVDALDEEFLSLYQDEKECNVMKKIARESGNISLLEKMFRARLKISDQRIKIIAAKTNLINTPTADVIARMEKGDV